MRFSQFLKEDWSNWSSSHSDEHLHDYVDRLLKNTDVKHIGSGAFSKVFQHPEFHNVVTKVFSATDIAYISYLKWAEAHQDNRYVPKIISVHRFRYSPDRNRNMLVVFLEKMVPASAQKIKKTIDRIWIDARLGADRFGMNSEIEKPPDRGTFDSLTDHDWLDISKRMVKKDPDLAEFASWVIRAKSKSQFIDMHNGNIMVDAGGHLVFTDPVAGTFS